HIPLYLYPFLNTTSKSRPFEYLRLTSLGVIGALVKVDDTEVISFLLSTEIIPLCLRTMEMGSELSKTVEFIDFITLLYRTGWSGILVAIWVSLAFAIGCRMLSSMTRLHRRHPLLENNEISELSVNMIAVVATFIVQKILLDDVGLDYICTTAERFFAVGRVLGNMVAALAEQPSSRLLKFDIIQVFHHNTGLVMH
ncbi:hypothetical protein Gohar_001736, partial [Gossypium harknessii]|nr:hypothetical protein [Gossypium harknessii]